MVSDLQTERMCLHLPHMRAGNTYALPQSQCIIYFILSRSVMSDKDNSVGPLLVNGGGSSRNTLGMCLPLGLRYRMIRDCCAGVVCDELYDNVYVDC
jgi:hypothetical protein